VTFAACSDATTVTPVGAEKTPSQVV